MDSFDGLSPQEYAAALRACGMAIQFVKDREDWSFAEKDHEIGHIQAAANALVRTNPHRSVYERAREHA